MIEGNDHIDDLIGKHLTGEASERELAELEQWISQSESNRKYFDHLQLVFDRASLPQSIQKFDVDAAWANVKLKIRKQEGKSIHLPIYWNIIRIAAVLVITFGLGFFVYQWFERPAETIAIKAEKEIVRDSLPDGSLAVLNRNTTIRYEYNPSNNKRSVVLEGEAFFEVKHDRAKPFIIDAGEVMIEDIGTTFNVKAFPDSPTVEVFVETGEVAFYSLSDAGLNLVAGETGIYNKENRSFARILKVDTNRLAYKTGIFTFRNTDLQSIINDLNAVYNTKVRLGNDALKNCKLTVTFRNEQIEDIVEIIAATLTLELSKEGDEYVLNGISCSQ